MIKLVLKLNLHPFVPVYLCYLCFTYCLNVCCFCLSALQLWFYLRSKFIFLCFSQSSTYTLLIAANQSCATKLSLVFIWGLQLTMVTLLFQLWPRDFHLAVQLLDYKTGPHSESESNNYCCPLVCWGLTEHGSLTLHTLDKGWCQGHSTLSSKHVSRVPS